MARRARAGTRPFPERAFHRWLRTLAPVGATGLLAMGDDVAALPMGSDRSLLLTTDALSEGTHFLDRSPPESVGAAAINASLSDLAAKGGRPLAALLDLLMPPSTPARWAQKVARGAEAAARRSGCHLVGGDTKPAAGRSVVGTMVGIGGRKLAPRSGARPGDLLVTTGLVGSGGANAIPLTRRGAPSRRALSRLLHIEPRLKEGAALAPFAHAMLDTSDGMGEASRLLAESSRVRVLLEPDRFPWDSRLLDPRIPPTRREELGFFGGDYELLAAVPARVAESARAAVARSGGSLSIVGRVEAGRGVRLLRSGRDVAFRSRGWDPFARSRPPPSPR
jgi:thiamine-monophosphate kinase